MRFLSVASSLLLLLCFLKPETSHAIIKAQVFYGTGSGDFKPDSGSSKSLSSTDMGGTLLLDPIPLVPVGFGVSVFSQTFDPKLSDHGVTDLEGYVIAPEIQAWLPFLPIPLTPYGRLSYALGFYKAKSEISVQGQTLKSEYLLTSSGMQVGIGAKYEPLPLPLLSLAILVEANMKFYSFEDRSADVVNLPSGLSADDYKSSLHKGSWNPMTFLVGIEVGI